MTSKIRVAFFADMLERDTDGAVRTMYQLIDRIPENKFEFLFFTGTSSQTSIKYDIVKIPSCAIPFNKTYKIGIPNLQRLTLIKSLQNFKPDVIHIASPSLLGYFALNYAQDNQIPVLSIYHTHYISYLKYYLKSVPFLISLAEKLSSKKLIDFYNRCDVVYVPTQQMMGELNDIGVARRKMKLWQRGLDTTLFHPGKNDDIFIGELTGNNFPCILFASRLVWEKNLETLFNIYDEIERQKINVNFIVVGAGTAQDAVKQRMKKAFFLGHINHETLAKVYASCKVLVFPSVTETYGNVVIEAMASGCVPVIAKGGGSQSLVKDNETGFLCQPNNASEYVEKIKILLHQPVVRSEMIESGLQYTSKLNWENLSEEYFNDIKFLSQFSPIKSNVFTINNSSTENSLFKKLITTFN